MADDESVSMFVSVTSATPQQAQTYLQFSDGDVQAAIELFFNSPDLAGSAPAPAAPSAGSNNPINVDDDDEEMGGAQHGSGPNVEDDEAMARRLQQEMYGAGGGGGGQGDVDAEGVRAPMARTTETLVGPGSGGDWRDDPNEMNAAIAEQMMARQRRNRGAPGIFNQSATPSIWNNDNGSDPEAHRRALSRATGGASDQTSKSNLLAELFRPPFDLISNFSLSDARDEGKENEKWILINVQDPSIFDCQVLNRDIWKNESIRETVKEHFIFLQYNKGDPRGQEYIQYYFANQQENDDSYPHIAIVDPRTGEQVKTWSGSPAPKASDFLMDLHEFLDRYSLSMQSKNPVQNKRKEAKKDVAAMTDEEMMEMAMQQSLANGGGPPKEADPDSLTKPSDKGKARALVADAMDTADLGPPAPSDRTQPASASAAPKQDTPFSRISSTTPHEEPTSTDPKETTRIQFRYSGGRVVRRFQLSEPVRRIYEWLKASPIEGKEGADFELIAMGKNLIDMLETPIADAGLKNGTVMVEFVEGDDE